MSDILQYVINGLSLGSIYALIALGYTMVFGVLKLINFAHSEVYMMGAFTGYFATHAFGLQNSNSISVLLLILVVAMAATAFLGYCIERFAYRRLRGAPTINLLITAVGVSMLLQFTGQLFFGSDPKFFPQVYAPEFKITFGETSINSLQILVFAIAVILMLILRYIIYSTRLGRAMRAVSFNRDYAVILGIPTTKIISSTFMIGSALAGAGGVLVGLIYPKIDPYMGVLPGLKAFAAAVLGGIGNVVGAVLGAFIIGLAEVGVVAIGRSTMRDALAFVVLILILLFKPTGLLGSSQKEKV